MCDIDPSNSLYNLQGEIPLTIESDDPLCNVGKRELSFALQTPSDNPWVADWLFKNHANPFHSTPSTLPPEAFDNALALHFHHDITTNAIPALGSCKAKSSPRTSFRSQVVMSKDIDMMLVPVARIDAITVGYAFLDGMDSTSFHKMSESPSIPSPKTSKNNLSDTLVCARFCFEHSRKDMCVIAAGNVNVPIMGIISMRYLSLTSRDRGFFVVPKSDYCAGYLPTRVLSLQTNIDYAVPVPNEEGDDDIEDIDDVSTHFNGSNLNKSFTNVKHDTDGFKGGLGKRSRQQQNNDDGIIADVQDVMMNYTSSGSGNNTPSNSTSNNIAHISSPSISGGAVFWTKAETAGSLPEPPRPPTAGDDDTALELFPVNATSGTAGIDSAGDVVTPSLSDAMLPDVAHDYILNYIDTDLYGQVLSEDTDGDENNNSDSNDVGIQLSKHLIRPDRLDELLSASIGTVAANTENRFTGSPLASSSSDGMHIGSDDRTMTSPSDEFMIIDENNTMSNRQDEEMTKILSDESERRKKDEEEERIRKLASPFGTGNWLTDDNGGVPDGIGMSSRKNGNSNVQTSSASFDFSGLADALNKIEKSFKGTFYGPKLHKDVMDGKTGELVSRCTGKISVKMKRVDINTWQIMKLNAVQLYYAKLLPVGVDNRFITSSWKHDPFHLRPVVRTPSSPFAITNQNYTPPASATLVQHHQHVENFSISSATVAAVNAANNLVAGMRTPPKKKAFKSSTNNNNSSSTSSAALVARNAVAVGINRNTSSVSNTTPSSSDKQPRTVPSTVELSPTATAQQYDAVSAATVAAAAAAAAPSMSSAPSIIPSQPIVQLAVQQDTAASTAVKRTGAPLLAPRPMKIVPTPSNGASVPLPAPAPSLVTATPQQPQQQQGELGIGGDEEMATLSKLEAKRIKNRLSAAKSNHKRRVQLEAQKKELALLKQRVEELKSKEQVITRENENLKKKVAQQHVST